MTDDPIIGRLEGQNKKIKLNFYYPEEELTTNSLIFDPKQMSEWWDYGYQVAKKQNPECRVINIPDAPAGKCELSTSTTFEKRILGEKGR